MDRKMEVYSLGQIIGERTLTCSGGQEVQVLIGAPQLSETLGHFCPYKIVGIGRDDKVRVAGGVDNIHALQMVFQKIGIDLYVIDKDMSWADFDKGNTGFPIDRDFLDILEK
jgi:hypothetical protein